MTDDRTLRALAQAEAAVERGDATLAEPRHPDVIAAALEWQNDWRQRQAQAQPAARQRKVPRFLGRRSRDADIDAKIRRALRDVPLKTEANLKVLISETVRLVEDRVQELRQQLRQELADVMATEILALRSEIETLRAVADRDG